MLQNTQCELSNEQWIRANKKAEMYVDTNKVKQTTTTCDDYFQYGIFKGAALSLHHLLTIILYTDNTNLCSQFTATFRRGSFYESIESVYGIIIRIHNGIINIIELKVHSSPEWILFW